MSDYFLPGQSDPTEFDPDLTYGGHSATVGYTIWEVQNSNSEFVDTVVWNLDEPGDYVALNDYIRETYGWDCYPVAS